MKRKIKTRYELLQLMLFCYFLINDIEEQIVIGQKKETLNLMFCRKEFNVTFFKNKLGFGRKKETLNLMFRRKEFNVTFFRGFRDIKFKRK